MFLPTKMLLTVALVQCLSLSTYASSDTDGNHGDRFRGLKPKDRISCYWRCVFNAPNFQRCSTPQTASGTITKVHAQGTKYDVRFDDRTLQSRIPWKWIQKLLPKRITCPCGNATHHQAYKANYFYCDACGKDIPKGTPMLGCRECDWDACPDCINRGVSGAPLPKPLIALCFSFAFYLSEAAEILGFQPPNPGMFVADVRWDHFEEAAHQINISEDRKTINNTTWSHETARAEWVPSTGRASGTVKVIRCCNANWVDVGVIERQSELKLTHHMFTLPTRSWYYCSHHIYATIEKGHNGKGETVERGPRKFPFPEVTPGDTVTVDLKNCILTFSVNGMPKGRPMQLPAGIEVALAVTLHSERTAAHLV